MRIIQRFKPFSLSFSQGAETGHTARKHVRRPSQEVRRRVKRGCGSTHFPLESLVSSETLTQPNADAQLRGASTGNYQQPLPKPLLRWWHVVE